MVVAPTQRPLLCQEGQVRFGLVRVEHKLLREIADEAGYTAQNVSALTGLHLSTILRHWHDPRWFEQVEGSSLQRLLAVVPGVDDYIRTYPHLVRQQRLGEELSQFGILIDSDGVRHAMEVAGIASAYISNALEMALHLARADARQCVPYLTTFWGCQQDRALSALFAATQPLRLLQDRETLLAIARDMHAQLRDRRGFSFPRILAQQILVHHLARITGEMPENYYEPRHGRTAFILRGAYMGVLIHTGDLGWAERYKHIVDTNSVARLLELWAFPTWTRDRNATPDFTLERSLLLRETAREVIAEVQGYNEAYVWYLVTTYIPLALESDPTFGLQLGELCAALRQRRDEFDSPEPRAACDGLLQTL
jgi:hypothetical protein